MNKSIRKKCLHYSQEEVCVAYYFFVNETRSEKQIFSVIEGELDRRELRGDSERGESESENLSAKELFGQKCKKAKEEESEKEYVMKLGLGYDKNAE